MYLRKLVTKDNFVRVYITVLNGLLQLTPREIDVYSVIVKLDLQWQPKMTGDVKNLLSTDNRRLVMKSANISKANLTRTVKKLLSIGLLELSLDNRYLIPELMKPNIIYDNKVKGDLGKISINFILDFNKLKEDDKV
jgi:hypothetical protein